MRPPDLVAAGLSALIDGLRDDVREDLRDLRQDFARGEERMTARIVAVEGRQAATHELLTEYARSHGELHEQEAQERRTAHSAFYDFIRKSELDQAKRDGALGVARYLMELVSKHGTNIAKVIVAIAGLLAVASGNVNIDLGGAR